MSCQETRLNASINPAAYEALNAGHRALDDCLLGASELESMGWDQLQLLDAQGEQVDHCVALTEKVHENLGKSEKTIQRIESWWVALVDKLRPTRKVQNEQDTAVSETAKAREDLKSKYKIEQRCCTSARLHPLLDSQPKTAEEVCFQRVLTENEERLEQLSRLLSVVKQQTQCMGQELDRQTETLDSLVQEVSLADSRTTQCIQRVRALY